MKLQQLLPRIIDNYEIPRFVFASWYTVAYSVYVVRKTNIDTSDTIVGVFTERKDAMEQRDVAKKYYSTDDVSIHYTQLNHSEIPRHYE